MSKPATWTLRVYDRDGEDVEFRYLGEVDFLGETQQIVTADSKMELEDMARDLLPQLKLMVEDTQSFEEVIELE